MYADSKRSFGAVPPEGALRSSPARTSAFEAAGEAGRALGELQPRLIERLLEMVAKPGAELLHPSAAP